MGTVVGAGAKSQRLGSAQRCCANFVKNSKVWVYQLDRVGHSVRNRMPWCVQYAAKRTAALLHSKAKTIWSSRYAQYQPDWFAGARFAAKSSALFHRASRSLISVFG